MHEMSLIKRLLLQVQEIAREHHSDFVGEITVELGPLSGVEPELVRIAFEQVVGRAEAPQVGGALARSTTQNATLTIRKVPLVVRCLQCDGESDVNNFIFLCDNCGSGRVRIVSGDAFRLLSVTLCERAARV